MRPREMRPRERRETGEQDLFRSRLDQIIDTDHALVKLARTIDWKFLEEKLGAVYNDGAGQPPLPTRLMAGLAILKHAYDLSDEVVCELWIENPYYQYFCGEEFFQHRLPLDRSSMTRWRNRMGEERLQALLQESLAVATKTGAMKPGDLARVIVDTTVQPKNISFPTEAKLLNRAREKLVKLAKQLGVELRSATARAWHPPRSRSGYIVSISTGPTRRQLRDNAAARSIVIGGEEACSVSAGRPAVLVRLWHSSDLASLLGDVRSWGQSGNDLKASALPSLTQLGHWTIHYSITLSAAVRRVGGTVRPRAFAVLRLMTSSKLVGC